MTSDTAPQLIVNGSLATIRLCRPVEHNRLDPNDLGVLLDHLHQVTSDVHIRVVVLTGSGRATFSSGYTIQAIRNRLDSRLELLMDTIEALPLPVICVLNGSVYGGAIDMALCCDFRIGVRGIRMRMPAAAFGLHYYPGGIRRYITQLGLATTKKLFLTAQTVDADEMLRIGFLTELAEFDLVDEVVTRYVNAILECEPGVLRTMKRSLNQTAQGVADIDELRSAYEQSLRSDVLRQRLEAKSKDRP